MKIISECFHFILRWLPGLYVPHPLTTKCSHPESSFWELWGTGPTSSTSYFYIQSLNKQNSWLGWSNESCPCRDNSTAAFLSLRSWDKPQPDKNILDKDKPRSWGCWMSLQQMGIEVSCGATAASWSDPSASVWLHLPSVHTFWWQHQAVACPGQRVPCTSGSSPPPQAFPCLLSSPQDALLPSISLLLWQVAQKGSVRSREAFSCPVLECFCGDN